MKLIVACYVDDFNERQIFRKLNRVGLPKGFGVQVAYKPEDIGTANPPILVQKRQVGDQSIEKDVAEVVSQVQTSLVDFLFGGRKATNPLLSTLVPDADRATCCGALENGGIVITVIANEKYAPRAHSVFGETGAHKVFTYER